MRVRRGDKIGVACSRLRGLRAWDEKRAYCIQSFGGSHGREADTDERFKTGSDTSVNA